MSARNLFAEAKAARDAAHQKKVATLTQPDAVYLASLRAAVEEASNAALRHKPADPLNFVAHRLLTAGAPRPSEGCGKSLCEAAAACLGHRPAPPPLTPAAAAAVEAEVQRAIAAARKRADALRREAAALQRGGAPANGAAAPPPETNGANGAGRERAPSRHDALRKTDRQSSFERRPSSGRIGRQNSFGSRSGFQAAFPGA